MPVYVLVTGYDGQVRATVAEAGNLKQLHTELRGVDDAAAGQQICLPAAYNRRVPRLNWQVAAAP